MKVRSVTIFLWFSLFASASIAENSWSLKKDSDSIRVYTQKVQNSAHKAVRAYTEVSDISLASLISVILDAESCPEWAELCKQSYIYKSNNDADYYVYTLNDLPFPVKDRDALTHVSWEYDQLTDRIVMNSVATEGIMETRRGSFRLTEARIRWTFELLDNGNIGVESWAHVNPGSAMPAAITNRLLVGAPYKTMKGLVAQAQKEKYASANSVFIDNLIAAQ